MTRIMAIEGRKVTVYNSYSEAESKTGLSTLEIARLINNGKMKNGICFDISLDSDDKE